MLREKMFISYAFQMNGHHDSVSEWLRRWTRNPLGSAREGSNPFAVAFACTSHTTFKTKKSRKLLTHFSRAPHAVVSNWVNCLTILHTRGKSNERTKTKQRCMISITFLSCLDARVVEGVDLRSTGLQAAWVRNPLQALACCHAAYYQNETIDQIRFLQPNIINGVSPMGFEPMTLGS